MAGFFANAPQWSPPRLSDPLLFTGAGPHDLPLMNRILQSNYRSLPILRYKRLQLSSSHLSAFLSLSVPLSLPMCFLWSCEMPCCSIRRHNWQWSERSFRSTASKELRPLVHLKNPNPDNNYIRTFGSRNSPAEPSHKTTAWPSPLLQLCERSHSTTPS